MIEESKNNIIKERLIKENTRGYSKARDSYYIELNSKILILTKAQELKEHDFKIDIFSLKEIFVQSLQISVKEIFDNADEMLNIILFQSSLIALDKLGTLLNQDQSGVGQSIISEHACFKGFSLSIFNEKTQKHGIDYVLAHLESNNDINKIIWRRKYNEFEDKYKELVEMYLKGT